MFAGFASNHVLWLPPQFRPAELAVADSTVAIGCESGRVVVMRYSGDVKRQSINARAEDI